MHIGKTNQGRVTYSCNDFLMMTHKVETCSNTSTRYTNANIDLFIRTVLLAATVRIPIYDTQRDAYNKKLNCRPWFCLA